MTKKTTKKPVVKKTEPKKRVKKEKLAAEQNEAKPFTDQDIKEVLSLTKHQPTGFGRPNYKQLLEEKFNELVAQLPPQGQLLIKIGLGVEEALKQVEMLRDQAVKDLTDDAAEELSNRFEGKREPKVKKVLHLPVEDTDGQ